MQEKQSAIVGRWREYALAAYADEASAFLRNERNRFANPVGHVLRSGTEGIYKSLLSGMDAEEICGHLDAIIKVRAIQDLSPSQAVSFVFALKRAIREELGGEVARPDMAAELAGIDAQIDQIALFAFDIYTRCREKVSELRINEVKRSVAAVMEKLGVDADPSGQTPEVPGGGETMRGDGQ